MDNFVWVYNDYTVISEYFSLPVFRSRTSLTSPESSLLLFIIGVKIDFQQY
jgi:hypothetical protein